MAPSEETGTVAVDGRLLRLTNLDKILYPATHTTKAEVLTYYAEIAPLLINQTRDRPTTRKRWPDGVGTGDVGIGGGGTGGGRLVFFVKNLESGAPDWVRRVTVPHKDKPVTYPLLNDLATLTWMAQLAALEIHVPQWRFDTHDRALPADRLVLDLDPGPGVGLAQCAEVARWARTLLREMGLDAVPVTSGSKGIHLYAPFDEPRPSEEASQLARDLARTLEAAHRDLVTSVMRKDLRDGKIFVDWSQNNAAKTTVAPYSLRGIERPTVSTPLTWEEVAEATEAADLRFEAADVVRRIDELGDLLADMPSSTAPLP